MDALLCYRLTRQGHRLARSTEHEPLMNVGGAGARRSAFRNRPCGVQRRSPPRACEMMLLRATRLVRRSRTAARPRGPDRWPSARSSAAQQRPDMLPRACGGAIALHANVCGAHAERLTRRRCTGRSGPGSARSASASSSASCRRMNSPAAISRAAPMTNKPIATGPVRRSNALPKA